MTKIYNLDASQNKKNVSIKSLLKRLEINPNDKFARNEIAKLDMNHIKLDPEVEKLLNTPVSSIIHDLNVVDEIRGPKYSTFKINGINIAAKIPKGKRYVNARKIALLFHKNTKINKYKIIKIIQPKITNNRGFRKDITKNDYIHGKDKYDTQIKNSFKYLKTVAKKRGYTFKILKNEVLIIPFNKK